MRECLKDIKGLEVQQDRIVAASKLGPGAQPDIAEAIERLVKEDRLEAACMLLRLCRPSLLHALLDPTDDAAKSTTMKCVIWHALAADESYRAETSAELRAMAWLPTLTTELLDRFPAGVQRRVLSIAVEQAMRETPTKKRVTRLRELAVLSIESPHDSAKELRSQMMRTLVGLSQQWQIAFATHGQSHVKLLQRLIAPSLPDLLDSFDLEVILGTDQGRQALSQAVIERLSGKDCSQAMVVSLFAKLAHRVELTFYRDLSDLLSVEARMAQARLEEEQLRECTPKVDQWAPGWRLLMAMARNEHPFKEPDKRLREAAILVDIAAAGKEIDGRLASPRLDGWGEDALLAMLNVEVDGKPLLSDAALGNAMRAFVSDLNMATRMFERARESGRPPAQKDRLYRAKVHALIGLPQDEVRQQVALYLINEPDALDRVVAALPKEEQAAFWNVAAPRT